MVVAVVALVALVAIVAIFFGRHFYGKASPDGAEMRVGGTVKLTAPKPHRDSGELDTD